MAAIDSLLGMLIDQGGDELRLVTDEAPRMFARGAQQRLTLPVMPQAMLRLLLETLLTPEREAEMNRGVPVRFGYDFESRHQRFDVSLSRRGKGFEAVLKRSSGKGAATSNEEPTQVDVRRKPFAPSPPPLPASDGSDDHAEHSLSIVAEPSEPGPYRAAAAPAPLAPLAAADLSGEDLVAEPGTALAAILASARNARASDVHLLEGAPPVVRVDGNLRQLPASPPVRMAELLAAFPRERVQSALAGSHSLDGTLDFADQRVRFSIYRTARGTAAALRLLPRSAPLLSDLKLPVQLGDLAMLPHGLVLVCGPTGSGKSATLAAIAREVVRRRQALLLTLEDPVEYVIQGEQGLVRQREVGRDVPDFASGLRDALRADPDALLVGEMRDPETIGLALTAAETGHLVFASLHSRSAASAVERIVDGCPGRRETEVRAQLAQALRAIVSQRLLPRANGNGRVAAVEMLRCNHNVASLVREGKTTQLATAMQSGRKEGMVPLEASLAELVKAGTVTREAAMAVANDITALTTYLGM